jgi:DNA-directed RNA polymerase subunit RPC12/RpoP
MNEGRFICAWCGADLGPSGTEEDSHGICPDCLQKMALAREIERAMREQQQ